LWSDVNPNDRFISGTVASNYLSFTTAPTAIHLTLLINAAYVGGPAVLKTRGISGQS